MEKFKPEETDFVGVIKGQMRHFIQNSKVLSKPQKEALIEELGMNWYDKRFSGKEFFEGAVGHAIREWEKNNLQLAELWKQIAIQNATNNNQPHKVATDTVESFRKQFNTGEARSLSLNT